MSLTDHEKLAPYLATVIRVADESGRDRALFAAQGFRESGFGWAPGYEPKGSPRGTGDGGHGHGLYQIDDGTWSDWLARNDWGDPLVNMRKAAAILRDHEGWLVRSYGLPPLSTELFERAVFASFNCGPGNVRKALMAFGDPDRYTEHHDYSAWIWAKAEDLRVQLPELRSANA